jgi:hypothetical protein
MGVEGADGAVDELGQLRDAGLGNHRRATGTIGSDGAVAADEIGTLEAAQAEAAITRAGASDGNETEALDGAGYKFAVEAAAYKDADAAVAKAPGAGKQTLMPEGIDTWRRAVVPRSCAGLRYVLVPKGSAKTADGHTRDAGYDGEGEALFQGKG